MLSSYDELLLINTDELLLVATTWTELRKYDTVCNMPDGTEYILRDSVYMVNF